MGEFAGFIQDKLEVKLLILYIADRLIEPAGFDAFQELSMVDKGVDYFVFAECLADLVRTEHLSLHQDRYAITQKGQDNIRACESTLPYTVRRQADKEVDLYNHKLRRSTLVTSDLKPRSGGGYTLTLSLSDELDSVMRLDLLVTQERTGRRLQRNFQQHAERIYTRVLEALHEDYREQPKQRPQEPPSPAQSAEEQGNKGTLPE